MARDLVNLPSFHDQIRKTVTGLTVSSHGHHENGEAHEGTPLIGNGNGNGNGSISQNGHGHGHSDMWEFLFNSHYTPGADNPKPWVKYPAHVWHITKATLLSSPVNILLVAVPIGIIAGQTGWDPVAVFVINFFAIIPLAAVLSFATEEISAKLGEALGGLLNATFGNAVELIVSIIALRDRQIEVVKSSMIGSILSNLLLVMGMCFFFGGIANMRDDEGHGQEQSFQTITAQTTASLMTLSAASMILPGTLFMIINDSDKGDDGERNDIVLSLSRGTAIILLFLYVLYLFFQLRTHHKLFSAESGVIESESTQNESQLPAEASAANVRPAVQDSCEEEEVHMSPYSAAAVLIVTTVLVSICADYLVESIDALVERAQISRSFIGLILIPIVGNAAEHVTAVVVAVKNKMDLAMGVAIGSSIQIALFVTPFLVVLGWVMDREMDLHFETFETVSFALAVLVVIYTVQDGKSNYLEGAMLMALYIIIALAFFVTPSQYFNTDWVVGKLSSVVGST
ncbi:Calcium/proton exchanger [Annulohypoxylon maeteangense]|uniref:Calcium/proton exchanger n=1 Tax=Annulohypoxylon maeteangense TaxID=1927788 RepID=UPI0020088F34|nr:Calcium/proton exchanger [Annulohypoxylon maeteangense]KAI0888025.1 Calcium/proton exchanger [Annulohypoxylon maeteangense]